jgi:dihydrofolate reductase
VIVTRQRDYAAPGAIIAHSLQDAFNAAARDDEIFVIGGAELFREALPIADRIHLTVVEAEPEGDTFMPEFDRGEWQEVERAEKQGYHYALLVRARSAL